MEICRFSFILGLEPLINRIEMKDEKVVSGTVFFNSQEFFQALFEQSPYAIQIFDADGTFMDGNKAWEELWQARREDAVKKYNILKDSQSQEIGVASQFSRVLAGETVTCENIEYDPALSGFPGRKRYLRLHMFPIQPVGQSPEGKVVLISEDCSEKKEQEDKYRSVVKNATEAIIVVQNGAFVFFNPRTLEIGGYTDSDLQSRSFLEFVHPEDRSMVAENYKNRLQGDPTPSLYHCRIITKDGKNRWVEVNAVRIIWQEEPAVLIFLNDITARKAAELHLKGYQRQLADLVLERTKHLEALLTFSQELTDSSDLNSLYRKVTGITKDLLQFDFSTLFILDENEKNLVLRDTIGFPQSIIGIFYLLDGQGLPTLVAKTKKSAVVHDFNSEERFFVPQIIFDHNITSALAVPMMNKEKVTGVLIGHNLESRSFTDSEISLYQSFANQAAISISNAMNIASLQASEEKFRYLFENANDAIYLIDPESYRIVSCNRRASVLDGYSQEELVQMKIIELHPENELDQLSAKCKEVIEKGSSNCATNLHHKRKDGTLVPVEVSPSLVDIAESKFILSIVRDVTERKKAEKEKEIVAAKLRRSQKMEAIGLMAGGVAHDLNNILSGIVSYPQLLLCQLPEDSPLRKPIETMQQAGNRAAAVTADLITVARGVASVRVTKNLNNLIEEFLDSPEYVQLHNKYKFITVTSENDQSLLNFECSPVHISKILLNLILNAFEAIENEGVVVISTGNRYVDTPLKRHDSVVPGEYVVLKFEDNGPGISSNDLERIFEPFYSKKVMGRSGTGLGLAVVWNTVLDHNGYIDVSSSDAGTCFELYFPASRNNVYEIGELNGFSELLGNGESILVVDDVESQREIACGLLEELGYRAEAVSSGEEALSYLEKRSVDLVVLDMIMEPGINGRQTWGSFGIRVKSSHISL